ncbi:hypothetical protein [Pseudonocardia spinosispora]|uniref:hypothetical protein n=1 Tax=Pseudonocardia spinosispora TaxID=103441 RepID=UPI0004181412|nr:hypothetical protein [Pseudonocardia spinosispora]
MAEAPARTGRAVRALTVTVSRRPERAVRLLGVVVCALALVGALCWWRSAHQDRLDAARAQATSTAVNAVTDLLSYDYRSIDQQVGNTRGAVTGGFADDYARLVHDTVAPGAKDQQLSMSTSVLDTAVVSGGEDEVELLVFLDQQSRTRFTPKPGFSPQQVRVTMLRTPDGWRVSQLRPV